MADLRSLVHYITRSRAAQYAAVTLVAVLAAAFASRVAAIDAVEATTQDVRVANLTAPIEAHPDIVVVALTETTLDSLPYRSPIDRGFLADLVDAIAAQQPKVIGVDVLFDRATDAASDRRLRETLRRHRSLLVLSAPSADGADLPANRREFWREVQTDAETADGSLILSRRDQTVRVHVPAGPDGAPRTFSAAIAARAGAPVLRGELVIPFRRSSAATDHPWPFATYEALHVLHMPAQLGWFRDKIVLVGGVLEAEDRFATPTRFAPGAPETTPGVIVHAQQVAQLVDGTLPQRLPLAAALMLTCLAGAVGVWAGAALSDWRLLTLALTGAALLYAATAFAAYAVSMLLAPIVSPLLALIFSGAGGAAVSARRNAESRRALDLAFRHYLAPEVVDEIARRPEEFMIAGDEREVSILVTDIEGFTSMLSRADARALGAPINEYFDALIEAVIAHGGAVDKIVGDGLIALFGAPARRADHAERAVRCALAIDEIGERFRCASGALAFGRTRIGVSTGMALVGSFGGAKRINYTAYGSIVNLADRLQGANRIIGTRALISAASREGASALAARPVGRLMLRGMGEPETAYEPRPPGALIDDYLAAYEALAAGSDEAAVLFAALARAHPEDALAAYHASRLARGAKGLDLDLSGR